MIVGDPAELFDSILDQLGREGARRLRVTLSGISKTLQSAVNYYQLPGELRVNVQVPHYWAIYLNDGRGVVRPVDARVLVWFQNPKDDPRTDFGRRYPVRYRKRRRLSQADYYRGLEENRRRYEAGLEPFMIVRSLDGSERLAGPAEPKHFMERTFARAAWFPFVERIVNREVSKFLRKAWPREKDSVSLRLRV